MKNIFLSVLTVFYLFFGSCQSSQNNHGHNEHDSHQHNDEDPHDHDHDHEEESLTIVTYSAEMELFAEADPFIMNERSAILAHFTWLSDFKPVENAEVTLQLTTTDGSIAQTVYHSEKPGIYMLEITPRSTGAAQLLFEVKTADKTHTLFSEDLMIYSNAHEAMHALAHEHTDHPSAIPFTKEQSWQIDFKTEEVGERQMSEIIKSVGELQPTPTDEIILVAGTHGNVMLLKNDLLPGKQVNAGQPLINITGSSLAEGNTRQRFIQAANNYEKAAKDHERAKTLWQEQIISEQDFLEAKRNYENAKVIYNNLSENFSESGQVVKSELNGFVKDIYVTHGEHVEAGTPLVKLHSNQLMMLEVQVQRKYANLLPLIADANVVASDEATWTLDELNGKMITHARSTSEKNRMLPVYFHVTNPGSWINGTLLDVFLKTQSEELVMAVPNSALIEEQGNFSVLVQINPEFFEKRSVKTGQNDGLYTRITHGLKTNERIVTQGAIMVKLAAASAAIDPHSGHVH